MIKTLVEDKKKWQLGVRSVKFIILVSRGTSQTGLPIVNQKSSSPESYRDELGLLCRAEAFNYADLRAEAVDEYFVTSVNHAMPAMSAVYAEKYVLLCIGTKTF